MRAVWRGSRDELMRNLRLLPAVLTGQRPDPHELGKALLREVGAEVLELIHEAFLEKSTGGTGSDGITWAELKEVTLERRRLKGIVHDRKLEEEGDLLRSLTPPASGYPDTANIPGQVFDLEPGSVTVGTDERKADFHQYGTERIPARPVVPPDGLIPPAWEADIDAAIERGMEKVIEIMCLKGGVS